CGAAVSAWRAGRLGPLARPPRPLARTGSMNAPRVLRSPTLDAQRRAVVGPAPAPSAPSAARALAESVVAAQAMAAATTPSPAFEAGHEEGLRQGLADA